MAGDPKALADELESHVAALKKRGFWAATQYGLDRDLALLVHDHADTILAALRASDGAGAVHDENGRTAYEARFAGEARITPWAELPEQARAVWRRVEAACAGAVL